MARINLITPILVLVVALTHAADNARQKTGGVQAIWKSLSGEMIKNVAALKKIPEQTFLDMLSSQCSTLKMMAGLEYNQMVGVKEPDLGKLALDFAAKDVATLKCELSKAAQMITSNRGFNPKQKLYIYLHGFSDSPTKETFAAIRDALFSRENSNVLALDGSSLIQWLYLRSTTYVGFIGDKLGEVLAAMTQSGVDPAQIHLIGHSLGAHIAGFAGKQLFSLTGKRVGRISALDPAGPCFSYMGDGIRLNHTDADFVDVIHTDAGLFGIRDPVGHVDYYPNSGSEQPNCLWLTCNHGRAWQFYAESVVNEEAFPAVKCDSWDAFKAGKCSKEISYMGHPSKPGTRGLYFLQTGGESPFGLGLSGTKWKNTDGLIKNIANQFTSFVGWMQNNLQNVH